ncbi:MAG: hypothetical protein WA865_07930 [Spirulinaceae cyanobacterium]
MKDLFAREAIVQIPKILTLMDRNCHSPTYGCFDRNFWQYKIIDFPSGMSQEFVWPLALAYHTHLDDNPFFNEAAIAAWVEAGILYAAKSSHPDGSCDDYFPFERAGGAAAFSLLACLESYQLLGLKNEQALAFFELRADWLAHHNESGRLTNHQALIVLCLELLSPRLNTAKWDRAKVERLEKVLSWQNSEGWFQEYEGCDPGYHTLTISCLARIYQLRPDPRLKEALIKAVDLAAQFIHPDGSYGGEYTSRNTYNFFPHGFELVGKWYRSALTINDQFLQGLAKGLASCYADDHIIGHHTWNYLLAWQDFVPERPALKPRKEGRVWYPNAKILIDRRRGTELYLALNKGGVFKFFRNGKLVASDTQFSLLVNQGGKLKNAVAHLVGSYDTKIEPDDIFIQGDLGWAKQKQMTPLNLMILRVVMLTVGRFFPNLIRKLLQKVLITGKKSAPYHFSRKLRWQNSYWQVIDELSGESWDKVESIAIGGDQTSIYVVMSRTYQAGQLQPWQDFTKEVKQLSVGQKLKVERDI